MGTGMPLHTEHSSGDSCLHPSGVAISGSNHAVGTSEGCGRSQVFHTLKIRPKCAVGIWEPNCRSHLLSKPLFNQYPFSVPQNACQKSELKSLLGMGWSNTPAVWRWARRGASFCPSHQGLLAWLGTLLLWQNLGGHSSECSNLNTPSKQIWESLSAYVNRTRHLFRGFSVYLHTPEPSECCFAQFCPDPCLNGPLYH